jgi:predicted ATP-grasp superfamily ATP-dependent carboligase
VLVTTGMAWGSLLGVLRSLGARGITVHAVGLGARLDLLRRSRYRCETASLPYDADSARTAERLTAWWRTTRESERPVMIPMSDRAATCVAEAREILEATFDICAASPDVVQTFLDKRRAHQVAARCGLCVPRSGFASTLDDLDRLAAEIPFPIILKPTWWREEGSVAFKTVRCDDRGALVEAASRLIDAGATLAAQEFVPGGDADIEIYMFYRSRDGAAIRDCTGRKLRQVPAGAGIMASGRTEWLPEVAEMSRSFLDAIDYRGLGGIEYKRHDGRRYFIEMSVRPEGFHPLAIRAGVDLPWCAYSDIALGRVPAVAEPQRDAYWLDELPYVALLRKRWRHDPLLREAASLFSRPGPLLGVFSSEDPLPGLAWSLDLLRGVVARTVKAEGRVKRAVAAV